MTGFLSWFTSVNLLTLIQIFCLTNTDIMSNREGSEQFCVILGTVLEALKSSKNKYALILD